MRSTKAPVYYALSQAQFNPVAAMAKYVDDIQDILRRTGYTLFEPHQTTQIQVADTSGRALETPEVTHAHSWLITKADRTSGFILGASSLTYHTTHYETRNEFLPALVQGLRAVHEIVTLDHVSRVGLRILDAVIPNEGEQVSQYLAEGLQGVAFNARQRYSMNESVFETKTGPLVASGTLVSRVYRAHSPLGYPPDLVPHGLRPMPRFDINETISHAVIDIDHFSVGQIPIDFEPITAQLTSLHASIKESFEATIAPYAKEVWQLG